MSLEFTTYQATTPRHRAKILSCTFYSSYPESRTDDKLSAMPDLFKHFRGANRRNQGGRASIRYVMLESKYQFIDALLSDSHCRK